MDLLLLLEVTDDVRSQRFDSPMDSSGMRLLMWSLIDLPLHFGKNSMGYEYARVMMQDYGTAVVSYWFGSKIDLTVE